MKSFFKIWLSIGLIAVGFGIIILVIAIGSGGLKQYGETYSLKESYENVKSIDIEIGYGEVAILEGNEFSINATNLISDGMESYVKDGTWVIREDYNSGIEIFGASINLENLFNWNYGKSPQIVITIPKDFVAQDFKFNIGAGYANADVINALSGNFTVGAGEFEMDQLNISEKSTYYVGTGHMVLTQLNAKDISVDCGVGEVVIEGTIIGDNDIKCGIGKVELDLTGEEDSYSYEVTSGLGNVSINEDSYSNISNEVINHNGAENKLNLECGIGDISVEFN